MEEIELLFPRAKKEVWVRRRVVSVMAVGVRSRRAGEGVSYVGWREWWRRLTEEEVLQSEEQVEGYVLRFCLGEEEEGC
jgi:hypothetical protein